MLHLGCSIRQENYVKSELREAEYGGFALNRIGPELDLSEGFCQYGNETPYPITSRTLLPFKKLSSF
jgi:hypothetical protein